VSFAPTSCDGDNNNGCPSTGSVVTAPVDGISGSSFSIMIWVKRERVGVDHDLQLVEGPSIRLPLLRLYG
jgi:hypothetical protein